MAKKKLIGDKIVEVGRKSKLTPELTAAFAKAVEEIYYITKVCDLFSIHPHTIKTWLKKADDHEKIFHPEMDECTSNCDSDEVAFRTFKIAIKRAQALFQEDNLKALHKHKKKNWLPAAWLLERTDPDNFGLKQRIDNKHSGTVNHIHSVSIESRQRALAAANKALELDSQSEKPIETEEQDGVMVPIED